jgi:hypothetical protein
VGVLLGPGSGRRLTTKRHKPRLNTPRGAKLGPAGRPASWTYKSTVSKSRRQLKPIWRPAECCCL